MKERMTKLGLTTVWNLLGILGGLLSIASLAENLVSGLVKWKGWIESIVSSYRGLISPMFDLLFEWLPWTAPVWIGDYIVIGAILGASVLRGVSGASVRFDRTSLEIFFTLQFFWPITFPTVLLRALMSRQIVALQESGDVVNEGDRIYVTRTVTWCFAILVAIVILLSINSAS